MARPSLGKRLLGSLRRIACALAFVYVLTIVVVFCIQRTLMYHPTHEPPHTALAEWRADGTSLGFFRRGTSGNAWLFLNGNTGQASRFTFAADRLPAADSVYFLEYPGFGDRKGKPSMQSLNAAAEDALARIRAENPGTKVFVIGVSIGTGPASHLGSIANPPERIVLIVPYCRMAEESQYKYPWLPAKWLVRDNWDNAAALRNYRGRLQIFADTEDRMIPIVHARALRDALPQSEYTELSGGHGDWDNALAHLDSPAR